MPNQFHYQNIEQKKTPDGHVTRKVTVYQNGKGYKSITTHHPRKSARKSHRKTVKKPLTEQEIAHIKQCKFIPGLFNDCTNT